MEKLTRRDFLRGGAAMAACLATAGIAPLLGGCDALQQPAGRVGTPEDIAETVLFLCSDKAGFITGENVCVDGGMTRLMIYHGENGWEYRT